MRPRRPEHGHSQRGADGVRVRPGDLARSESDVGGGGSRMLTFFPGEAFLGGGALLFLAGGMPRRSSNVDLPCKLTVLDHASRA